MCFCTLSTNRKRFADVLRHESRESDVIRRLGGDEFVVLLTEANGDQTSKVVQRLHVALAQRNVQGKRGYEIRFSVGHTEYDAQRHASIADLLASSGQQDGCAQAAAEVCKPQRAVLMTAGRWRTLKKSAAKYLAAPSFIQLQPIRIRVPRSA